MIDSYDEIFARRADRYDAAMRAFPDARDAEFAAVIDPLPGGAHVIFDMPAGAGYLRRHLPADVHYVAVEPAAYFHDRCPVGVGAERILGQIEDVDRADGAADIVISLAGLHHAPDLGVIFREVRRLLRPGGLFVLADVAVDTPPDRFLNIYVHANNPMGHVGCFLADATAGLLEAAGFGVIADDQVPVPWRFTDAEAAGQYCRELFGIDGRSAAEVAEALRDTVGIAAEAEGVTIGWSLRRIVCRAD